MKLSIRIDDVNPVHTRLSIFSSRKLAAGTSGEMDNPTRAHSGTLTIDTASTEDFIDAFKIEALVKVRVREFDAADRRLEDVAKNLRLINSEWRLISDWDCPQCGSNIVTDFSGPDWFTPNQAYWRCAHCGFERDWDGYSGRERSEIISPPESER